MTIPGCEGHRTVPPPQTYEATDAVHGAYSTLDRKECGIYNWYLGDGACPAGMTRLQALEYFEGSVGRITASTNNCGLTDPVPAKSHYAGTTTYEADMSANSTCTARDGKSTWDADASLTHDPENEAAPDPTEVDSDAAQQVRGGTPVTRTVGPVGLEPTTNGLKV